MVIRLSVGSTDIGGNKGDCNAKFAATPHRHSMVLVKYSTQRIHRKLGGTQKSVRKKFSVNIQAPSITGGSQGVYAEERRKSTLLYTTLEYNQKFSRGRLRRTGNRCLYSRTSSLGSRGRNRKSKTYDSSRANETSQQIR
jgi:hypothetical protein